MRKINTLLLLFILSLSLSIASPISAQDPDIEVAIVDEPAEEGGNPLDVVCKGDQVTLEVNASANDAFIEDPHVLINIDPVGSIQFDSGEYFIWFDEMQGWMWWIGGISDMYPGYEAILRCIGNVTGTGPIKVTAKFYAFPEMAVDAILLDTDSYNILSRVCNGTCNGHPCRHCHPPCAETIPMQPTGIPVAMLAVGLLTIISGTFYSKN